MPIIRGEITETVDIATNGTHNVAQYTSANVNVQPSISSLNVTPTTSAQTITAPSGTDGYSPVNVSAVTSAIDANITAGNIKKDVTILGVTGSYEGGGSATQYGVNLKGWCGDVDTNTGLFRTDQAVGTLSIPTLTYISAHQFENKFNGSVGLTGVVDLSAVNYIEMYGLSYAFSGTGITGVNLQSLQTVDSGGLQYAFSGTNITSLEIPLVSFGGWGAFASMCDNCLQLQNVYLYVASSDFLDFVDNYGTDPESAIPSMFSFMINGCSNCVVHFYIDFGNDLIQWYTDNGQQSPWADESEVADYIAGVMHEDPSGFNCSVAFDVDPT